MQKQEFELAMTKLNHLISQCKSQRDKIDNVCGFENLTVVECNKIITDSKNFKIRMDQVLNAELYHMIGMGNLNAIQLQIFCKGIKELTSYRYLIECLSQMKVTTYADNQNSTYNCRNLGLTFTCKNGELSSKIN